MTGEKCIIRVETQEQWETLQDKYPMVMKAFLSDNCGHSTKMKNVLEEQCQLTNGIMPFEVVPTIYCPVEKKFCREELVGLFVDDYKQEHGIVRDLKKKEIKKLAIGVPFIVGADQTGSTYFTIGGSSERSVEAVQNNYSTIRTVIKNTKKKWVNEAGKR